MKNKLCIVLMMVLIMSMLSGCGGTRVIRKTVYTEDNSEEILLKKYLDVKESELPREIIVIAEDRWNMETLSLSIFIGDKNYEIYRRSKGKLVDTEYIDKLFEVKLKEYKNGKEKAFNNFKSEFTSYTKDKMDEFVQEHLPDEGVYDFGIYNFEIEYNEGLYYINNGINTEVIDYGTMSYLEVTNHEMGWINSAEDEERSLIIENNDMMLMNYIQNKNWYKLIKDERSIKEVYESENLIEFREIDINHNGVHVLVKKDENAYEVFLDNIKVLTVFENYIEEHEDIPIYKITKILKATMKSDVEILKDKL